MWGEVTSINSISSPWPTTRISRGSGWLMKRVGLADMPYAPDEPMARKSPRLNSGSSIFIANMSMVVQSGPVNMYSRSGYAPVALTFHMGQLRRMTVPIMP